MKRILAFVFGAVVLVAIILGIIYGGFIPTSKDEVIFSFEKNEEIMQSIAETLSGYPKNTLVLSSESDIWEMYNEFFADFEENVIDGPYMRMCPAIHNLFEGEGYKVIIKNENYILFSKQESYDFSSGVVYSTDGEIPRAEGVTEMHVLAQDNWYYWESEYDLADKGYFTNPEA